MSKTLRTDRGGLPATILFRCPKGTSESAFNQKINQAFSYVFNVPAGQRIMSTDYLADIDSILCYFRVGEATPGHGFMLLPPNHPEYSGGSTEPFRHVDITRRKFAQEGSTEPFIGTRPLFAVGLGNTITYTCVDRDKLDELDIEHEHFEYAARVNERLSGIQMVDWSEFQKVTRSILVAHLIEGQQKCVAVTLVPQNEDCVFIPMLNDVLRMDSTKKSSG